MLAVRSTVRRGRRVIPFGLEEVQSLLLLASESSWIAAWSLTLGSWIGGDRQPLVPITMALLMLTSSLVLTRFVLARSSSAIAKGSLLLFGAIGVGLCTWTLLPSKPPSAAELAVWAQTLGGEPGARVALGMALVGGCWQRGMTLGRARPGMGAVEDSFSTGTIAMAALLVIVAVAGRAIAVDPSSLILPALVMVSAGLIGMPVARVVDVSNQPSYAGKPRLPVGGQWLALLLAIVVALILASLLLTELLTFERIGSIWSYVSGPAEILVRTVVRVLAIPFTLIVGLFTWLNSILPHYGVPKARQGGDDLKWLEKMQESGEVPPMSPEVELLLKGLLLVIVAAIGAWLALRAIRRVGARQGGVEAEESHDFVWSWPGTAFIARWILSHLGLMVAGTGRKVSRWFPAADNHTIRGLYRRFLALGASMGAPRSLSETPTEYSTRLLSEPWAEGGEAEVRTITAEYNRHRYGPDAGDSSVDAVDASLSRLGPLWKRSKGD